jgi:hypothetical protein
LRRHGKVKNFTFRRSTVKRRKSFVGHQESSYSTVYLGHNAGVPEEAIEIPRGIRKRLLLNVNERLSIGARGAANDWSH